MRCTFRPYEGREKYIFVSYSHRDGETIAGMLEALNEKGFRIWYDEGIEWGTEWPESIAMHLHGCAVVMAFHSKTSIVSRNCRQEINYALKCGKDIMSVYLEDVELSKGMDMQLSSYQSTYPYQYANQEEFYLRLTEEPLLRDCRSAKATKQIDELSTQMSGISQNLTGDKIISQADIRDHLAQVGVEQIKEPATAPEPEIAPPLPASGPKPESAPVPKTSQKAEDASMPKQEDRPTSQLQPEEKSNSQIIAEIQPAAMPDMKIKDGVLVKYDGQGGNVVIPEGVIKIDKFAFSGCKFLLSVTIPAGVKEIGNWAFSGCKKLVSVSIPESVYKIGSDAFSPSKQLKIHTPAQSYAHGYAKKHKIRVQLETTQKTKVQPAFTPGMEIENGVLVKYDGLGGDVVIPEGVTAIGDFAFFYCKNLTSVTIPVGVITIGDSAFGECENLVCVTIPDSVTTIGFSAFGKCKNLVSVTIPDSVTTIGSSVFEECENLVSIIIPDGVTVIGSSAFMFCYSLEDIYIPASVSQIGTDAFEYCDDFLTIHTPAQSYACEYAKEHLIGVQIETTQNTENIPVSEQHSNQQFASKTQLVSTEDMKIENGVLIDYTGSGGDVTVPEGVIKIGNRAFEGCENLTSVTIPVGVTTIGDSAFAYCKKLKNVVLPEGLVAIGKYAFDHCAYGIYFDVFIPKSVFKIRSSAFEGTMSRLIIHTPAQSYAHGYAKKHNIMVQLV